MASVSDTFLVRLLSILPSETRAHNGKRGLNIRKLCCRKFIAKHKDAAAEYALLTTLHSNFAAAPHTEVRRWQQSSHTAPGVILSSSFVTAISLAELAQSQEHVEQSISDTDSLTHGLPN